MSDPNGAGGVLLPPAPVDFNALHNSLMAGKSPEDAVADALLEKPASEEAAATEAADTKPAKGKSQEA